MNTQLKKIDYLPFLESCWQEHLQPKADNAPKVISTFAGCGGSSLGYSMAGFKELLAVEWDNHAVETFKLNFPNVPVYHGDIAKLSVDQVLEKTGLKEGELDIFDGSPPCQGFSTAGKRDMSDDRNQLFREYARLLRGLKPKVFVMENVSGMVKGVMKFIFVEILKELKASGYKVSARILNAMYFNVPQSRERMIFIGVREDLGIEPSHPVAESKPVTSEEAFKDCNDKDYIFLTDKLTKIYENTDNGKTLDEGYAKIYGNNKKMYFTHRKIDRMKPCGTISKSIGSGIYHYSEKRLLSIQEIKRLASFPDSFQMVGKYSDKWARIGNSVPPLFMRSIAKHIRTEILNKCPQP